MPDDRVKYSDAIQSAEATTLENDDVLALAREDSQSPTGYSSKATRMLTVAKKVALDTDFSQDLETTSPYIIGAINELAEGGGGSADIISEASGAIATFNDGGDNIPVKSLVTNITATQAGTGTPAPSNQRAITGFDNVKVVVTGKNLMPSLFGSNTNNGITYTVNDDNTITVTGQVPTGNSNRNYGHIILPAGTYTLSGFPDTLASTTVREAALVLCKDIYSGSQNIIVSLYSNIARTATFTLTEATDCYLRIYLYAQAGAMPANTVFKVQIEKGEEATEYEKFKGTTHTITLPETIYGGNASLTEGTGVKTVVDRLDLGSLSWARRTDTNVPIFQASLTDWGKTHETADIPYILCEMFNPVSATNVSQNGYDNSVAISADGRRIYIQCQTYTDATTFTNAVNGKYVVYELATPTAFTFTGANIPTLSGENNIYSNTGDAEVEYFNENADQTSELIDAKQEFCNYSYDEKVVGTWVDGSPLYEKTLYFNNVKLDKTDSTSELVHGVDNIGTTRFVAEVYFKFPNSGQDSWSPANCGLWNNGVYNFYWCVGLTSIWILSASGVYFDASTARSYLVKIRYTKT